jgi:UDP-glucose 4-epimerase
MKTYITGASGFLGSYLTKKLQSPISIPHNQIHTTKLKDFNYFYFLSSYGNLSTHVEDSKILKANVTDLIDILLQTKWGKVKSFVFVSTSSVKLPVQTMYSRAKRAAEEILLSFAEIYKAPICIVRPFSITGPGEQKAHLIPRLIDSCLTGAPLEFVGSPKHDYIDVSDVVEGILALSHAGARGTFELGTGKSYSNQQVLGLVEKLTGKKANIKTKLKAAKSYDTKDWISQDFGARNYGWIPKIKLEETIAEMVGNYE